MKAMICLVALLAAATYVESARGPLGRCLVFQGQTTPNINDTKTCDDCQWTCLTNTVCSGITFNGQSLDYADLVNYDCGNGYFTEGPAAGLCVLLDATSPTDFFVYDVQNQGCPECVRQCNSEQKCTGFYFNYELVDRCTFEQSQAGTCPQIPLSVCGAPPSPTVTPPPKPSPVPVVLSPAITTPKTSPAVPVPSPAVPVPSPAKPSPSPAVPSPSPKVPSSPFIGINIVPGLCNVSNIRYTAPVVVTSVQSYNLIVGLDNSDDCCGLCRQLPNCNIMAFCTQPGGCGNTCVNGVAPFDQATELGPGASCVNGNRYPLGTCQLQFAADYFAIPRDSINFDGWLSALVVPEVQSQFPNLPTFQLTPLTK